MTLLYCLFFVWLLLRCIDCLCQPAAPICTDACDSGTPPASLTLVVAGGVADDGGLPGTCDCDNIQGTYVLTADTSPCVGVAPSGGCIYCALVDPGVCPSIGSGTGSWYVQLDELGGNTFVMVSYREGLSNLDWSTTIGTAPLDCEAFWPLAFDSGDVVLDNILCNPATATLDIDIT